MRRKLHIFILAVLCAANIYAADADHWQTPAHWRRALKRSEPGTFLMDQDGIEFRSTKFNRRWKYVDIHTFDLSLHELTVWTYQNRPWHEPGERPFRFVLREVMPPELAARFTARVGKPVRNGDPIPGSAMVEEIPAHHRVWSGGSNGMLRLKNDGIDYVAENGRDSRSWRWSDIQTIANPNSYEFRVTGFREIAEFDLKQPVERQVFERLWDRLYANGLNISAAHREEISQ